jgi:hypothetical protein
MPKPLEEGEKEKMVPFRISIFALKKIQNKRTT